MLLILISSFSYSQITTEKQSLLLKTFDFIHGQQYTLSTINQKYPKLITESIIAETEFNKSFSRAISKIILEIQNIYGNDYEALLTKLEKASDNYIKLKEISEKEALTFINKVKSRAKGSITSPELEILLKYEYIDDPKEEFLANYINTYSVVNYSNSQKLSFSINIPKSWVELDGSLSSTLKKFRSEYGIGNAIITVSKRNLSKNTTISGLINEKVLEKSIPENSRILSINKENINGYLTSIIQYEQLNQKTSSNQKRHIIQYSFKYKNTLLLIEYAIYGTIKDELDLNFKKFNELFYLITKSIKINNNYLNKNVFSLKEH